MNSTATVQLSSVDAAALGVMIASMLGVIVLFLLVYWVLLIIARWKMYTKAGEAGWKSIIPIYSDYVLYRLVWNTTNFWIFLGLSVGAAIFAGIGGGYAVNSSGQLVSTGGPTPLAAVSGVLSIVALVWSIRLSLKTAAAYGKGTGFGIGLVFLPNIFSLILGFGSAEYVGPQE